MGGTAIHREDVKALLRKRYGSIEAFQDARGLTGQQVRDLLRGKSNAAKAAVAEELEISPDHLVITTGTLPKRGTHNTRSRATHRLSEAAE
ncbi:MAG: helix-turn-helix domain-containing protein [Planctomycetaceae bacterium]|nr:helix-turn-helix domain-containing protein [Planctomycetaceae bacterium]